jgi:hypothetical protein
MQRIGVAQRRARLVARHHLTPATRAADVVAATRDLVVLHATDPATVHLSAWARVADCVVADLEKALYDDRVLVRMLGMRRTVYVVPLELAPVVQAACTRAVAVTERRKTEQFVRDGGISADPERWVAAVGDATLAALRRRGPSLTTELSAEVPGLAERVVVARGKPYEGSQTVASRMLPLLAADGLVVRGRPRGGWSTVGPYRWSPTDEWLPGGLPDRPVDEARRALARAWLARFGPAPAADLKWWAGWTVAATKEALAGTVEVDLGGTTGYALADDLAPTEEPAPAVALLPALDPTTMGWQQRDWYLGEHAKALFDTNGNAGPTVWWRGRVIGGWAQRRTGEVVVRLLEDAGAAVAGEAEAEADRLRAWLGEVRVTPRFRTPLERELTA